jgi:tRNA(adenine34) deaminase
VTPDELVAAAIAAAEDGMAHGEMPIGAVVETGGVIIATAFTRDQVQQRRLIHADLLATISADRQTQARPAARTRYVSRSTSNPA